ncbi:MAG: hypothetical protein H7095_08350 [Pseudopedobacter sp.]|nr:hypothetical protein [Deinococcales bacterium]
MAETIVEQAKDERTQALEARERLKAGVDELVQLTSLHVKVQAQPLKYMGGSAGGGFLLGLLLGRRGRKVKKVYIERGTGRGGKVTKADLKSEAKLVQVQQGKQNRTNITGAITGILVTTLLKIVQERFLAPQLENYADKLLDRTKTERAKAEKAKSRESEQRS